MEAAKNRGMRNIKLTGREASVVRVIGFAEAVTGAEIQESTHMEPEDVLDTVNSLISAGFAECIPYSEEVQLAELPTTAFELNPSYAHDLRTALTRR